MHLSRTWPGLTSSAILAISQFSMTVFAEAEAADLPNITSVEASESSAASASTASSESESAATKISSSEATTTTEATSTTSQTATTESSSMAKLTTTTKSDGALATITATGEVSTTNTASVPSLTAPSLPTLTVPNGAADAVNTYPAPSVPPTSSAPFMQSSSLPSGFVFIIIGAILAVMMICVLVWRSFMAWSSKKNAKKNALVPGFDDSKGKLFQGNNMGMPFPNYRGGGYGYQDSTSHISLKGNRKSGHLRVDSRPGTGGAGDPHDISATLKQQRSSLFYSPTADALPAMGAANGSLKNLLQQQQQYGHSANPSNLSFGTANSRRSSYYPSGSYHPSGYYPPSSAGAAAVGGTRGESGANDISMRDLSHYGGSERRESGNHGAGGGGRGDGYGVVGRDSYAGTRGNAGGELLQGDSPDSPGFPPQRPQGNGGLRSDGRW